MTFTGIEYWTCTDAQANPRRTGNRAGGPYKIVNNFLNRRQRTPIRRRSRHADSADIEIRHNHFFKPLTWMQGNPCGLGHHGNPFILKNHFELKTRREFVRRQRCRKLLGGFSQACSRSSSLRRTNHEAWGRLPICQVTDVTIRNGKLASGWRFPDWQTRSTAGWIVPPFAGERYSIHDVVLDDITDGAYKVQGQLAQVSTGLSCSAFERRESRT